MRTLAALLVAFPLQVTAQVAQPQQGTWTTEPPPSAAPAQPPAAAPVEPAPAPAQPTYPPQPQYPPPPQAAPPAPPAPAYVRPAKARDRWYIGFGVGGGDGKVANATQTQTFKQAALDQRPTTVFLNFKVGATMTPKLLLGLDVGAISSAAEANGVSTTIGVVDATTSLGIANVDAVATFFPTERGFFVKGGFGRSAVTYAVDVSGYGKSDRSVGGWNVVGGLGYAWWLGRQFNLTANLEFSRQWYGGSSSVSGPFLLDEIADSQFWSLWVGFDWY